ncbi:hypothetical protein B0H19DRAFT_1134285 [Mycena capillaripes]|nr:hypothetical protein B0H19DRAFT_1134285 [Mycena capillaripes]
MLPSSKANPTSTASVFSPTAANTSTPTWARSSSRSSKMLLPQSLGQGKTASSSQSPPPTRTMDEMEARRAATRRPSSSASASRTPPSSPSSATRDSSVSTAPILSTSSPSRTLRCPGQAPSTQSAWVGVRTRPASPCVVRSPNSYGPTPALAEPSPSTNTPARPVH